MATFGAGVGGLDRRAMEEARLARLAKKRPAPTELEAPAAKFTKVSHEVQQARSASHSAEPLTLTSRTDRHVSPLHSPSFTPGSASGMQYPKGIIRKTWCFGYPRESDIKIEEVLQAGSLTTALISSFVWDFDWLASKLGSPAKCKLILVMSAATPQLRTVIEKDFEGMSSRVRLVFPPMHSHGIMHSKLVLLFHPTHLRIVIPTGNIRPHDWGEDGGVMENSVFLIDLLRLPQDRQGSKNSDNYNVDFYIELLRFLKAQGMYEDAMAGLSNFDFSATRDLRFVHTIHGTHVDEAATHTGLPSLSKAVSSLGCSTLPSTELQVDIAASSIGNLDAAQLTNMHNALHGLSPFPPLPTPKASGASKLSKLLPADLSLLSTTRIVYPSVNTIKACKGGPDAGGTLFFPSSSYSKPTFPKQCVHEYVSRRSGCLSHSKLIFARSWDSALLYIGSANLSSAAWGRCSVVGVKKPERKVVANNWECGVLVPIMRDNARHVDEADVSTVSEGSVTEGEDDSAAEASETEAVIDRAVLPFDIFEDTIDVPFHWPPQKYDENQLPWSARGNRETDREGEQ